MSVEFTSALEFTFSSQPYKPGLSFTNRESRLQNRTFIYKRGFLGYKWDSRVTIYHEQEKYYLLAKIDDKKIICGDKNTINDSSKLITIDVEDILNKTYYMVSDKKQNK